jgi:hypothetical protein
MGVYSTSFLNPCRTIQSDRIQKTPKLALVDLSPICLCFGVSGFTFIIRDGSQIDIFIYHVGGCLLCADTLLLETAGKNREFAEFLDQNRGQIFDCASRIQVNYSHQCCC